MQQNSLILLAPIRDGQLDPLRQLLAGIYEPRWIKGRQQCHADLDLSRLTMLHFACFAVLDENETPKATDPIAPCLLFEATVDGDPDSFLDELIELCGTGLDHIFGHCDGYPRAGTALPHLVKRYLLAQNVRPQIHFQGHPGRTVAEIRLEYDLRRALIARLPVAGSVKGLPPSGRGDLLRHLRRFLLHPPDGKAPDFRWAAEPRAEPFATRWGRPLVRGLGLLLLLLAAALGIWLAQPDTAALITCLREPGGPATGCGPGLGAGAFAATLAALVAAPFAVGGALLSWLAGSPGFFWTASAGILGWVLARLVQFGLGTRDLPGDAGVGWMLYGAAGLLAGLLRRMVTVVLAGLFLIALPVLERPDWLPSTFAGLLFTGLVALVVGAPAILWLRYLQTLPAQHQSFGHANARARAKLSLISDVLWLVMAGLIWAMLLLVQWVFDLFPQAPEHLLSKTLALALIGGLSALVLLSALLLIGVVWLLTIYAREKLCDDRIYRSARILVEHPVEASRFAREGHGVNKEQNHMVSLTRIKPGRLRLLRLRLILFIVNQMSRWWFTRGELGDVHGIHFLRWTIVNKGRHLLFLDTYQGSWTGYLDAFIDSGSVRGLNAIWSHTYQYVPGVTGKVGFPRTECLAWKGARDERPFKEAVRASQRETIVWYSAYPEIGGSDIIANSRIRDRLFQKLDTAQQDTLIDSIH